MARLLHDYVGRIIANAQWHMALRELRGGMKHFSVFLACLILGVGVITAVGTLARSIQLGINNDARGLLGGDAEIVYTNYLASEEQKALFDQYGEYSQVTEMRAMVSHEGQSTLTELRAVEDNHPLVGKVVIEPDIPLSEALQNNGAVVESSLLLRVGLEVGDTVKIGNTNITINGTIVSETDRISAAFSLGPRMLVSQETIKQTGLILPGSLIRYRYRVAMDDVTTLNTFLDEFRNKFPDEPWRLNTSNEGDMAVGQFMERLEIFLTLAGLATLLIGGVGITTSVKAYLDRKQKTIAIAKTLGATRETIFNTYMLIITMIALVGSFFGIIFGLVTCAIAIPLIAHLLPVSPTFHIFHEPIVFAYVFGILTSYTFSVGTLGRATEVRPATLFRGVDVIYRHPLPKDKLYLNIFLALLLVLALVVTSQDPVIAFGFVLMAMVSYMIFSACTHFVKHMAKGIHVRHHPSLRLAITNIHRVGSTTSSIILSVGIGLTVLIALVLVESNFQNRVTNTIPERAPSLFFIDIQPYQKAEFLNFLHEQDGASRIHTHPMIRGRITHIKDVLASEVDVAEDALWVLRGDRGISYSSYPPENANVVEGTWWSPKYKGDPLVSLDKNITEGLGLDIGDTITLNILGEPITATLANIRDIDYSTFQINFSIIMSGGVLNDFPQSYIATIKVHDPEQEAQIINDLSKIFPNVSAIEIRETVKSLDSMVENISTALRVIVLVTLISGMIVLAGALRATLRQRIYDTVVMKVVGATRKDIIKAYLSEYIILTLVATIVSSILGIIGSWLILERLNARDFIIRYDIIFMTSLICLMVIAIIGFIGNLTVFQAKASPILRNE